MPRFSKKSSLVRHFQNVHDIVQTDSTEVEDETSSLERSELTFSDLGVISVPDSTMSAGHDTDLSHMNKQFNVEVSYCEDIGDILNVPNDTLFIMDTAPGDNSIVVHESNREPDTENLEEIEKFLEESKVDSVPETPKALTAVTGPKEVRISKDNSYRIPKSPKKPNRLKTYNQQTPHIPYQKEASLTVISVEQSSTKPKIANSFASSSKTPLTSPKKLSFEEALNVALAPSPKRERIKPAHKTIKVIRAEPFASSLPSKQKTSTSHTSTSHATSSPSKLSKTVSPVNNEEKGLDLLKRDDEDRRPFCTESGSIGLTSPASMSRSSMLPQQYGVVEPRQAEPYKRKSHGDPNMDGRLEKNADKKSRHKQHRPLEPSRRSSHKSGTHPGSSSATPQLEVPELGSSHWQMPELRGSQDKFVMPCELNPNSTQRPYGQTESSRLVDELRSPNKIPQLESDHNPCSTSPALPLSDQKQQNKSLLSPESTQGPSLRLEMSEKMQATLTSALSTITAAPVAGYYTSRAAASGLTNIESEEEESKDEKQGLTLLPTNFPTFDASSTSMSTNFPTFDATSTSLLLSSLSSLQSLPSKPTAVVSPSR